ncbi:acyl-CoA--6-aminopenicillanic acid acyl-transferase [Aureibaculum sp. A20]|uniref:Acyl-CoA--6-aminopenicillanic acid acyl-transferase n=1 Tax=Aureibaculum flavum TaxID=2795986 RepID=A0ABS0WM87_9FLAO|nr:C45 family peptidase [Aureibaculum flavum]MBJ2173080.1 acyl-CoA--6-aminopenicillanic acid acyl-transferase [Aureibaculum flavum]
MFCIKHHGRRGLIHKLLTLFGLILLITSCGVKKSLKDQPKLEGFNNKIPKRVQINDSTFVVGKNQLRKNKHGLWELYVKGDPLERGLANGSLTKELLQKQEGIFFSKVEEMVPSKFKQMLLRKFLAWYNRKLYLNIVDEYKTEIYGVSRFAGDDYDYVADDYMRSLYLHGAHDIGHALKDLALVGCSSFAVWDDKSADGGLLIGRNFDFYAGDEFAKQKIIAFVAPDTGYKYMSVTWGGMIGVVSGMNNQGLTVTINAGKSDIPLVAKTPISLLTREILQYASTIEEAIAIAKKRQVFVSEAILVGSAKDHKAVTIEVSPNNFGVYEVANTSQLLCSNHFQSDAYANDENNIKQKAESHSQYRYERMEELLSENNKINPKKAVSILRNTKGLHDKDIGYGNEKALNQLLAHHGIVFQPDQLKVWISTNPYQLGEFVSYDLNKVFEKFEHQNFEENISEEQLLIPADDFIKTEAYRNYELYRQLRHELMAVINAKGNASSELLKELESTNPEYWEVYELVGKYYYEKGYDAAALIEFKKALTKEITTVPDRERIEKYVRKIEK